MQNRRFSFGPISLTGAAANVLNPPTVTGGVNGPSNPLYFIINVIRVVNVTAVAATVTLYKGATGASVLATAIAFQMNVPANSPIDIPCPGLRFDSTDFLVGLSGTAAAINVFGYGEVGVSG